jgi:hypothetical protein
MLAWVVINRRHDAEPAAPHSFISFISSISFTSNSLRPYPTTTDPQLLCNQSVTHPSHLGGGCGPSLHTNVLPSFSSSDSVFVNGACHDPVGALSAPSVSIPFPTLDFQLSTVDFQPSDPRSPFPATLPRNPPVSLIIATLPKMYSRKPFDCHTSETPRGLDVLWLTRNLTMDLSYTPGSVSTAVGGGKILAGSAGRKCILFHGTIRGWLCD